jgi:hypothetical protein
MRAEIPPRGSWHSELDANGEPAWEPGTLRAWDRVAAAKAKSESKRSPLPAPMIIRDYLDGVVNPCNGKRYDSKSAYYQAVKDAGCEIVGNEAEKMMSTPPACSDVKQEEIVEAMRKVEAGYKPAPLEYDECL